ncbi:MAG: hypothetical protein ACRDY7_09775 [Acidimicrobiia bacterium]
MGKRIKFTRSSRKHKIGRTHALHVMNAADPDENGIRRTWIGIDDRGLELSIVGSTCPTSSSSST